MSNTFLVSKIEASGWPDHIESENDKRNYVEEISHRKHIVIHPDRIEKNCGRRFVAKLCLNSFWGKLAQTPFVTQSSIIKSPKVR